MDPLRIAHDLCAAAGDAWAEVAGDPDRHKDVAMGADGTPTSLADQRLDEAILEAAGEAGVRVLSEETGLTGEGEWTAVVDPLDGSRNAGRGIPFYCCSVAVGRDDLDGLEAGVVQNLVTGDLYSAARDQGARLNGRPLERHAYDPDEVMVAIVADYDDPRRVEQYQRRNHHIRDMGSAALECCLVGTGALDAFYVGKDWLRVIDIAAAVLFVREAGGEVVSPGSREPLNVPFDLAHRTGILAASCPEAVEAVL